jgi:glycosyltransferase involved in cell wall biosynthesis
VSVVVPVRDEARFLGKQLGSLAAQDYDGDWEVVVADNGSVDGSREVALAVGPDLPSLRVVDASARRGAGHARNVGAAAARGELLAFCDADDAARPGWLGGLVRAAGDAEVVAGRIVMGELNDPARAAWPGRPPPERPLVALGWMAFASTSNCAYWSDVFQALGGFDERLLFGDDVDLSWRAQLRGGRLAFAAEAEIGRRPRDRVTAVVRQHWSYGRAAGTLARLYREAGLEYGVREELRHVRALPRRLRKSLPPSGATDYVMAQLAMTAGRAFELARLRGRGGGIAAIPPAAPPSSPS